MTAERYSDAALEKQAAIERLSAEGQTVPLAMFYGMCEPRVQPTDAERCQCCQSDAREGAGGDGRHCGLCLDRGHGESDA